MAITYQSSSSVRQIMAQKENTCCGKDFVTLQGLTTSSSIGEYGLESRTRPPIFDSTPRANISRVTSCPGTYIIKSRAMGGQSCPPLVTCIVNRQTQHILSLPVYNTTLVEDIATLNLQAYDQLNGVFDSISGSIAEIDDCIKTVGGIIDVANAVYTCISHAGMKCAKLHRYIKRIPKIRLGDLPAAFLWYSFGLKPLVEDLHKIATAPIKDNTGYAKTSTFVTKTKIDGYYTFTESLSCKYSFYVRLKYPYTNFPIIGNPLEWAWERIPFSFVIDWVIPVSTYIAALGVHSNLEVSRGSLTFKREVIGTQTSSPTNSTRGEIHGAKHYESYRRVPVGLPGMPPLQVQTSDATMRLLNQISLLGVLMDKEIRFR